MWECGFSAGQEPFKEGKPDEPNMVISTTIAPPYRDLDLTKDSCVTCRALILNITKTSAQSPTKYANQ
eukprot:1021171-Amphidinium_carterae.2